MRALLLVILLAVHAAAERAADMTASKGRWCHGAALLPDGSVLAVGGFTGSDQGFIPYGDQIGTVERYDAAADRWTAVPSMHRVRDALTATLLPDGRVLAAGGYNGMAIESSTEVYDPARDSWTMTGSMAVARRYHTATLLRSGRVLAVGGYSGEILRSAELYDPAAGRWAKAARPLYAREVHTATALPDGRVLVAGGLNDDGPMASAELYDPAADSWTATGSMSEPRESPTAVLLPNGKVLVAGGAAGGVMSRTAELYDPATGLWTPTGSMAEGRYVHSANLLRDGRVLVAGGYTTPKSVTAGTELYDPASGAWTPGPPMLGGKAGHTASLLADGRVLIQGADPDYGPELNEVLDIPMSARRDVLMGVASTQWAITDGNGWYFELPGPAQLPCGPYRRFEGDGASTSVLARPAPPAAAPGALAFEAGSSSAVVRWPAGSGTYVVHASTAADFSAVASAAFTFRAGVSSAALTGLRPNTLYHLRAAETNCGGAGPYSFASLTTADGPEEGGGVGLLGHAGGTVASEDAELRLPAGVLPGTAVFTVARATFTIQPSRAEGLRPTGIGVEVTSAPPLQPSRGDAVLTLSYEASQVVGAKSGGLILARLDEASGTWVPLPSTWDQSARTVTGRTNHFSRFQIMHVLAQGELKVHVFPNPLRPARGHTNMQFMGVPAGKPLRVLDVTGRLVRKLFANEAGQAAWDGRDESGGKASSGVYLVVVEGKVVKVAVQR